MQYGAFKPGDIIEQSKVVSTDIRFRDFFHSLNITKNWKGTVLELNQKLETVTILRDDGEHLIFDIKVATRFFDKIVSHIGGN